MVNFSRFRAGTAKAIIHHDILVMKDTTQIVIEYNKHMILCENLKTITEDLDTRKSLHVKNTPKSHHTIHQGRTHRQGDPHKISGMWSLKKQQK